MGRPLLRVVAITAVLSAQIAVACDGGDLNPQPLPPSSGDGKETNGGTSGDNASPSYSADAGTSIRDDDGGADGGTDAAADARDE